MARDALRVMLPALLRYMPLERGQSRITRTGWITRIFERCGEVNAVLKNGITIRVDPTDYNGRMLYLFGTPDPKIVKICRGLLRRGDRFLDIGANHGAVGVLCADAVAPDGEVHLVEPQQQLCQRIQKCINEHSLSHIHLHEIGLLDREGVLALHQPHWHSGRASFVREHPGSSDVTVPIADTSSFLDSVVDGKPFGVKIDVEGAEENILPSIVRRRNLRFALFECSVEAMRRSLWATVHDAGLFLYTVPSTLRGLKLRIATSLRDVERSTDLLAVRLNPEIKPPKYGSPAVIAKCLAQSIRLADAPSIRAEAT